MNTELSIQGMTCGNCARHVTEALQQTPGVARASVSLEKNRATVTWRDDAHPAPDRLLASLREAGYEGAPIAEQAPARSSILQGWTLNLILGAIATIPMLIAEWFLGLGMHRGYHWFAFALATPVQILCGWRFYRGAWLQAKNRAANMDTLVALGSTTAYALSLYQLLLPPYGVPALAGSPSTHTHLYFMDAAAIITLISLGHWMEAKISVRAEETLKSLLTLAPDTARQIVNGAEKEVSVSSLKPGDLIALRPGDHIPTDGEIIEGQAAVDESMLTGESLPIEKSPGAKLFAGSINTNGKIVARVTALGEQTALAKIIEVVQRAQNSRASIQKLGDRISSIFVPIVVLIAVATAVGWYLHARQFDAAIIHAAAVLIIACPCAMGLATPIAIMAGANAAAKKGILIRDGQALEKSGTITAILFDKTGTLTQGRLTLAAFESFSENARALAASTAAPSRHPLSQAIAAIDSTRLPLSDWQEHRGSGLSATYENQTIRLGSLSWIKNNTPAISAFANHWTAQGASVLLLSIDDQIAAAIALTDTLKPNAAQIISTLRAQGKRVAMLTGDHPATARAIARQAGIAETEVHAQIRPEQKSELIRQLQAQGQRVAFVGDGINDAPALAQADLGIALGSGADAARQAADIILLRAGLEAIPEALALAQATLRTIKQNLFWAFFYNAVGVPLAALGFFTPMLSAAAMGLSDLIVIGNSLRLKNRPQK